MSIINLKLVNDYINGEDIDDKLVEKLENDRDFMICVITKTNDHKFYRFCSDNLKRDYNFVKFYVNKFKNNIDAIDAAATYYLEHSTDEVSNFELKIVMIELTKEYPKIALNYGLCLEVNYINQLIYKELINESINDEYIKTMVGYGFSLIFEKYGSSEIIMDYYALRIVDEIYESNKEDFETKLHIHFKNPVEIDKSNINGFLIDYISNHDLLLSKYVQNKTNLLKPLKDGIFYLKLKWNVYDSDFYRYRYEQISRIYDEFKNNTNNEFILNYSFYAILDVLLDDLNAKDNFAGIADEVDGYLEPTENINYLTKDQINSLKKTPAYQKLLAAINVIINSYDPSVIESIHIESEKCKVTKIRKNDKKNMLRK